MKIKKMEIAAVLSALLGIAVSASAQTGGSYDLSHNVIASGGSTSTGGSYRLDGTTGQGIAGTRSSGVGYVIDGGFWTPTAVGPTAAGVSISGRITTSAGVGIRNVRLSLMNAATGEVVPLISGPFGYYRFESIYVGQVYILSLSAKRFTFSPDSIVLSLNDELADVDFTGEAIL